jgi:hypothetical protein
LDDGYTSYLENVSWSVSMLYLFPFLFGMTLRYYLQIPALIAYLHGKIAVPEDDAARDAFARWVDERFNSTRATWLIGILAFVLNLAYFKQVLEDCQLNWQNDGTMLRFIGSHGLSALGLFAAIVQFALLYWVLHLLWRGFVLVRVLYRLFRDSKVSVRLDPLHPDGVCGLSPIGRTATSLNLILFLVGMYLSLKVIDKVVVQDSSLFEDIGNPLMLGGYVILAPLLFFLPLAAAHDSMREAKERLLRPLSEAAGRTLRELDDVSASTVAKGKIVDALNEVQKLDEALRRRISVWPFDFRSMQAFFGAIVVPLLPVLLPFVIKLLFRGNGA